MWLPRHYLRKHLHGIVAVLLGAAAIGAAPLAIAAESTGEQIYRDQCARCHGKSGEGTEEDHPDPLVGDKSIAQLAELIHETMPDDADAKCSAEDSAKVAAYIYDAFYSADARVRNKPPRIELSRLTVRQQQNAAADVIGSFRPTVEWGTERGLHAAYFNSRNFAPDALDKLTRINKWYCEQLAHLAQRLADTPEPGGPGSLLDNTLIVWTNELGKGNSHTLDNIPFVLVGGGLDFRMGRSLDFKGTPHNRLLLSLAHGFGHRIEKFGNPNYCADGPLGELV